jgi:hypothetical protein
MSKATKARPEDRVEQALDGLDVDGPARDAAELREVYRLTERRRLLDEQLRDAVSAARAAGYSWGKIAGALGVSAQAAHEHYRHVS